MGRPFGIPVFVAPSWFLVAAVITYAFAPEIASRLPGLPTSVSYLVAAAFVVFLYLSVLVHELSHSVVALRLGLPVRRISLHLLGGVSEIEREAPSPGREFLVAFAGPLLSFVLAGAGYLLLQGLEPQTVAYVLAAELTIANFLVACFNLLPGLPLDGGRVLQSGVWKLTGQRLTGVMVAAWVGRAVAVAVLAGPVAVALAAGREPSLLVLVWSALIAAFIWVGASQSLASARVRELLPSLSARRLTSRAIPVAGDVSVAEALRRAGQARARGLVVVDWTGRPTALVSEAAVLATPELRRPWVRVDAVARRLDAPLVLSADLGGEQLLERLRAAAATEYLVVEANGDIYGVLSSTDVERAFAGA
jgi:Zn-dependent protease/CBS domain-containing protein